MLALTGTQASPRTRDATGKRRDSERDTSFKIHRPTPCPRAAPSSPSRHMPPPPAFRFNDLPIELQREVFVHALFLDPRSGLRLVLVSKRARTWLQPYIFDIVVLGSTDAPLFRRSVNSMPAQFFATHVKNLCLSVSVEPEDATTILRVCRGVKNLAFWVDHLANPSARSHSLSLIATLHLHRLSTEITYYLDLIRSDSQQQAWVQRLTHLDVIFGTHGPEDGQEGPSPQTVVPHLDQLPRLTHLGLRPSWTRPPVSKADLRAMLDAALSLVVLVIYDESGIGHERVSSVDRRVVYIPYPPNVILEWEGQAHGDEMSVWTKAEGLVRRHAAEQRGVYFCQDS